MVVNIGQVLLLLLLACGHATLAAQEPGESGKKTVKPFDR